MKCGMMAKNHSSSLCVRVSAVFRHHHSLFAWVLVRVVTGGVVVVVFGVAAVVAAAAVAAAVVWCRYE